MKDRSFAHELDQGKRKRRIQPVLDRAFEESKSGDAYVRVTGRARHEQEGVLRVAAVEDSSKGFSFDFKLAETGETVNVPARDVREVATYPFADEHPGSFREEVPPVVSSVTHTKRPSGRDTLEATVRTEDCEGVTQTCKVTFDLIDDVATLTYWPADRHDTLAALTAEEALRAGVPDMEHVRVVGLANRVGEMMQELHKFGHNHGSMWRGRRGLDEEADA